MKKEEKDVAIIGVSVRFPKSNTFEEFWNHLSCEKSLISEVSSQRWDKDQLFGDPKREKNKTNSIWGGFIEDVDSFDASFFKISPREAQLMDPQQRMALELAWKSIEDAGYPASALEKSNTGVFMGVCHSDYTELAAKYLKEMDGYFPTGIAHSIISNRISYCFDFKGPSVTTDTACASSLVAIHQAVRAIHNHECDCALAGGVNLCWSPNHFIAFSQNGMLSKDGKCKAFDEQANGYVRGEGGGVLVLKPLSKAIEDQDQIYAVIKGTGTNHGGKTGSLTVTNPQAQADLIMKVYEEAGVSPDTVSYIEAHGPGTALGDPIEIHGLKIAFRELHKKFNKKSQPSYCGLGSVKTNIGHLEGAAGIAGVMKVLGAMKYKVLPASIHFQKLNPMIKLKGSSFYIVNKTKAWEVTPQQKTTENKNVPCLKRRAGVSSFGFGGANAHVIIEEYVDQRTKHREQKVEDRGQGIRDGAAQLIILSAKNEERLKKMVENLHHYLADNSQLITDPLNDITYTLQVGREAMEHRVAFVVKSVAELQEKLAEFISGKKEIENCFQGEVKKEEESLQFVTLDKDIKEAMVHRWISKGKMSKLAKVWVKGLEVDWNLLYEQQHKPRRISLPTYPFARERHWLPESGGQIQGIDRQYQTSFLHPLVQTNTSDFSEQRFSSTFSGEEFFLKDHQVKGEKVLPGVAYLEMAQEAIRQATGELNNSKITLKNVVWAHPITVNETKEVHIGLFPEESGEIAYEVYTNNANQEEPLVHSQGVAMFAPASEEPSLNLIDLRNRLDGKSLKSGECYEAFQAMGIEYGTAHQGIKKLYIGNNEVLAELKLPFSARETKDQFMLHPSMVDSALQATIGMNLGEGVLGWRSCSAALKPSLPFALESVEIIGGCREKMWALVRNADNNEAGNNIQKLDIDLCDDAGKVCVKMRGFTSRVLEGELAPKKATNIALQEPDAPIGLITMSPVWDSILLKKTELLREKNTQMIIIGGKPEQIKDMQKLYPQAKALEIDSHEGIDAITRKLGEQGPIDHLVWIAVNKLSLKESLGSPDIILEQNQGVLQVFRIIKALLSLDYGTKNLNWTLITQQTQAVRNDDPINPIHASVHGLVGSLAKEYPHWNIRLLDMDDCRWPLQEMFSLPYDDEGNALAYRDGEWFSQKLVPVGEFSAEKELYKTGGVYVVIGGAGGIGEVWSKWMMETYQAHIVWIGRREKDAALEEKLDDLSKIGPVPDYIQADATDLESLKEAYGQIKRKHTQINGVIHSAIVLLDSSLANMDEDRFKAGVRAKVDVSVCLANVFDKENLDFVLFFSSLTAFSKAAGQSNYAAGCTFKDAFAHRLAQDCFCNVKVMNWGYWGSVGIVTDPAYQDRMKRASIGSIQPQEGMEALEKLLNGPFDQLVFFKTLNADALGSIGEMNVHECIQSYPQTISCKSLRNLPQKLSSQEYQGEQTVFKEGLQSLKMEDLLYKLLLGNVQPFLESSKGLLDRYDRWLKESLSELHAKGYLKKQDDETFVLVNSSSDLESLWRKWEEKKTILIQDPNQKAQVVLTETCLHALPKILTGQMQATDVMFPNSSLELVEGIYKGNAQSDLFNDILGEALVGYIQGRLAEDISTQIKVLEIGAGTGGTTAGLLPKLKKFEQNIQEYCYTDLSKAFLMHAQEHYVPMAPYLRTQIFDVERSIAAQNIQADTYDVVIATNVLHATQSIRQTLRNTKAAMRRGGMLLLNEISSKSLFAHLTFGLLEGWWLYKDSSLRIPGSPGLYAETWRRVLKEEGFVSTFFPAEKIHHLGQQIIASESDGIVRQEQEVTATPLQKSKDIEVFKECSIEEEGAKSTSAGEVASESLKEKSIKYLKRLVAEALKMKSHEIDSSRPLEAYGVDSILVIQLTNTMRKVFDNISSTVFFEVQTIDGLVEYLIKTQKEALIRQVGFGKQKSIFEKTTFAEDLSTSRSSALSRSKGRISRRFIADFGAERVKSTSHIFQIQDIAIIGLSGRYPEAENIQEFWENLKTGKNCIREIPQERWDWKEYFDEERGKAGKIYSKWGGFLKEVDRFDPLFFQISPREAEQMDPQERLFLEEAYKSIEDSGYTPETLCENRKIGVFVGVMNGTYVHQSSYWSIANRVSYLLNFQGPSMAVDTACSSSLTAIHLALESLYSGTSECAIAGGVNLILSPIHYLGLSALTMLSSTNECKSFGDHADGFVDGEGVGAIVLKPLKKAIADHDHIYGVLKGSTVNASGKTNGYTVPNPNAQYELILEALKRSNINARAVSYIEAHGTGTVLGDPIEISGLTRAFEQYSQDRQFCSIGSVKSNIGHCESAAGIGGVTKVLLQMQNAQLAPSLHSKTLNPNIDFEKTPFVVQQELASWKKPVLMIDGQSKGYSRIAGVSSFGAGGSNAHVLIEEYENQQSRESIVVSSLPVIIVLSAKNRERLKEYAASVVEFIQKNSEKKSEVNLSDLAYTFQVGREAMEERLGLIVDSMGELKEKLQGFIEGREDAEDVYLGQVKRNKDALTVFSADEDMAKTIDAWIDKGKYNKLLDFWVKGLIIDWNKLYPENKPQRISVPTYPFAKERYWVSQAKGDSSTLKLQNRARTHKILHPLVQENTSDFEEQQFTSVFTGQEFFLKDHRIGEEKVFPGLAYLEMARVAGVLASKQEVIKLSNVVWSHALSVNGQARKMKVSLYPEFDGISYEVRTDSVSEEGTVHNQGKLLVGQRDEQEKRDINLSAIRGRCERKLSREEFYSHLQAQGVHYGTTLRVIDTVSFNGKEVLAKLDFPEVLQKDSDQFFLHPSMLEAGLQAAVTLLRKQKEGPASSLFLPSLMQAVNIYQQSPPQGYAYVRLGNDQGPGDQGIDIDFCNDQGVVASSIRGLRIRPVVAETFSPPQRVASKPKEPGTPLAVKEREKLLRYGEEWRSHALAKSKSSVRPESIQVIYFGRADNASELLAGSLSKQWAQSQVVRVKNAKQFKKSSEIDYEFPDNKAKGYAKLFQSLKTAQNESRVVIYRWGEEKELEGIQGIYHLLTAAKEQGIQIDRLMITGKLNDDRQSCWALSWIGYERSLGLIMPELKVSVVYGDESGLDEQRILEELWTMGVVRYEQGKRYQLEVKEIEEKQVTQPMLRAKGVYLITGGGGGLGEIFARYLAQKYQARLILTGRRPLNQQIEQKLQKIKEQGASEVVYYAVDVGDRSEMMKMFENITAQFGQVNGIIHAAGIESSKVIFEKSWTEFADTLNPKIEGTIILDESTAALDLDFMCYFSSISAMLGDFGGCDYAIANRFQMAYANYRENLRRAGRRKGTTVAINWPLWKDGGMGSKDQTVSEMYLKSSGQRSLEKEEGIEVWERILMASRQHEMVLVGQPTRVKKFLDRVSNPGVGREFEPDSSLISVNTQTQKTPDRKKGTQRTDLNLAQCVLQDLKTMISNILKIKAEDLEESTNLANFGFDSISLGVLSRRLSEFYELKIVPSLFFSYSTLNKLKGYFVQEYKDRLENFYHPDLPDLALEAEPWSLREKNPPKLPGHRKPRFLFNSQQNHEEPIAVIGMSGRFPGAENVRELWEILSKGQDVVQEIPANRWDWRQYYQNPGNAQNQITTNKGGFIRRVDEFDPLFFEISPLEAERMDPQQRVLLQEAWRAFEDAGYSDRQIRGKSCGVFIGVEEGEYGYLALKQNLLANNHNAILAARISYYLDLRGPNLAINTACASGLVALHQACQSLQRGGCEMALAGGVNLVLSPLMYLNLTKMGMLSESGRCATFDNRANGIVPAEAAAIVVLKPMSQAIADKDSIYGVIKASEVNYDGKTNGLTAPSGLSQKELIHGIYEKYGINVEDVDYIMAHGTGTKLGDPIEVNALKEVFRQYTPKKNYCALGSVKTNLGHTFAASGIVSLISLLLAMKNKRIPASLNCQQENEYINFAESPFYVNKKTKIWESPSGKKRLAATSAFGMSGTNAHVVLEEYRPSAEIERSFPITINEPQAVLIPLAAKTPKALDTYAQELLTFLKYKAKEKTPEAVPLNLADIAYTLQVGREAMEHRVVFVVEDEEDLQEKLAAFIRDDQQPIENCYQGEVHQAKETVTLFEEDEDMQEAVKRWIEKGKIKKLAELWAKGRDLDWNLLYGEEKPRRISLPTYPFAQERYWLPPPQATSLAARAHHGEIQPAHLHPLVQQNSSDFKQQRFTSTFEGEEFFLNDHRVQGEPVLPGVAYLEMARAATALASQETVWQITDVVWARPLTVNGQAQDVQISLHPDSDYVAYEIHTANPQAKDERIIHSEGFIRLGDSPPIPKLDLSALQEQCTRHRLSGPECYNQFQKSGLEYGPGHQGIESLWVGDNQVLAKLKLPEEVLDTADQFMLHPSLLDSVLQASIGLTASKQTSSTPASLPFALDELTIYHGCMENMWGYLRYSEGSGPQERIQKLDIDLCDEEGQVCVSFRGFNFRSLEKNTQQQAANQVNPSSPELGSLILQPVWQDKEVTLSSPVNRCRQRIVMVGDFDSALKTAVLKEYGAASMPLTSKAKTIEKRYVSYMKILLERIKSVILQKPQGRVLIQIIIPIEGAEQVFFGLAGFLKTARIENPNIIGQIIGIAKKESPATLIQWLNDNAQTTDDMIRYQDRRRQIMRLIELAPLAEAEPNVFKEVGETVLVTGGAGGLGLMIAQEIAHQSPQTQLILTGRSLRLTAEKEAAIEKLKSLGAKVVYIATDISHRVEVQKLVKKIKSEYGGLDGIIHGAGIIKDNFILKKTPEEVEEVLAPKVAGVLNLDETSRDMNLKYFVSFSSTAGVTGNIGQGDYAAGNAFMDGYMAYRQELVKLGKRQGKSVSINWSLWERGGMRIDEASQRAAQESFGLWALPTAAGLTAFRQSLGQKVVQSIVFYGESGKIKRALGIDDSQERVDDSDQERIGGENPVADFQGKNSEEKKSRIDLGDGRLKTNDGSNENIFGKSQVSRYLKQTCARVLKIALERMDEQKSFSSYGVDSIMVTEITRELEKELGALPKTLFFQYQNIAELSQYFWENHQDALRQLLATNSPQSQQPETVAPHSSPARNEGESGGGACGAFPGAAASTGQLILKANLSPEQKEKLKHIGGENYDGPYLLELWPYFYLSGKNDGYLHALLKGEQVLFVMGYTGAEAHKAAVLKEVNAYAQARGYQICYGPEPGLDPAIEAANQWLSTPIGVIQTIQDIAHFDLQGNKKRKLRYAISRFEKAGKCATKEYQEPTPQVNQEIREVILAWCEQKKYVHSVKTLATDLTTGNWRRRYRMFLTYCDGTLQNMILIRKHAESGYLMDQEYYRADMPLGATEYAVVEIIKQLASEGAKSFSLGITWGIIDQELGSDQAGKVFLADMAKKETFLSQIFKGGQQNYQYKNKFQPQNQTTYFYRPKASQPEIIIEFLTLFIENGMSYQEVKKHLSLEATPRPTIDRSDQANQPKDEFFDVTKISSGDIRLDLMSDSWVYFRNANVQQRIESLTQRVQAETDYEQAITDVLGCPHIHLTPLGRSAESLFFQAMSAHKGQVLANVLFETAIHHQAKQGFQLIELPNPQIFDRDHGEIFRGGMNLPELERCLKEHGHQVSMIFLEVGNNASGGYPVAMKEIKAIRRLSRVYQTKFVLDITRIVKNALLIREFEAGYEGKELWEIVREMIGYADHFVGSLSKDFGLHIGGIVGSQDGALIDQIKRYARIEGGYISEIDQGIIGEALGDLPYIEQAIHCQTATTRQISQALAAANVPLVRPALGHCLLIPVSMVRGYKNQRYAKENFLRELWKQTGIRAGVHLVGTQQGTLLNDCVRLCLPLGLTDEQGQKITDRLKGFVADQKENKIISEKPLTSSRYSSQVSVATMTPTLQAPMAIVGMSGRFPLAGDLDQFWQNLKERKNCIQEIPPERWDEESIHSVPTQTPDKPAVRWGGFLTDIDQFDPLFFGISPKEAKFIDPQERLILETVWQAIEDAGYTRKKLSEQKTGVFLANAASAYGQNGSAKRQSHQLNGLAGSLASNRISYVFNIQGRSEAYHTACSSSFVALHQAVQSMRCGECQQAIVGGGQLLLEREGFIAIEHLGFLSRTGQARSFDQAANGYVRSEGIGAILIKPLDLALAAGDHIYALIRGTGVCHGGHGLSLSAPSVNGIKEAMVQAYRQAHIDPRTVRYIEAHGIASPMSDAIELEALKNGYNQLRTEFDSKVTAGVCHIGSIKPNIGHTELASGMAVLVKVIKAMQEQVIPGVTGFQRLNDQISLEGSPFQITAEDQIWETIKDEQGQPLARRASLNSYGVSGVNAHVVLEEYLPEQKEPKRIALSGSPDPVIFILSARNPDQLKVYAQKFLEYLQKKSASRVSLSDIVYTLQIGREALEERLAMVVTSKEELTEKLTIYLNDSPSLEWKAYSIFTGNSDQSSREESKILTNDASKKDLIQDSLQAKDFSQLSLLWVNGFDVPWCALYEGRTLQRVSLPTYPFARQRYWISDQDKIPKTASQINVLSQEKNGAGDPPRTTLAKIEEYLITLLSEELELPREDINPHKNLQNYGVDSIVRLKIMHGLQEKYRFKISGRKMLEFPTVRSLGTYLVPKIDRHGKMQGQDQIRSTESSRGIESHPTAELSPEQEEMLLERFKTGELSLEEIEQWL